MSFRRAIYFGWRGERANLHRRGAFFSKGRGIAPHMHRLSQRGFGAVDWVLIVAILVVGVAVLVPYTISVKQDKSVLICVKNLRELDKAMRLWQLDKRMPQNSPVTLSDILPKLADGASTNCPGGGQYIVTGLTNPPACTIPGHALLNEGE